VSAYSCAVRRWSSPVSSRRRRAVAGRRSPCRACPGPASRRRASARRCTLGQDAPVPGRGQGDVLDPDAHRRPVLVRAFDVDATFRSLEVGRVLDGGQRRLDANVAAPALDVLQSLASGEKDADRSESRNGADSFSARPAVVFARSTTGARAASSLSLPSPRPGGRSGVSAVAPSSAFDTAGSVGDARGWLVAAMVALLTSNRTPHERERDPTAVALAHGDHVLTVTSTVLVSTARAAARGESNRDSRSATNRSARTVTKPVIRGRDVRLLDRGWFGAEQHCGPAISLCRERVARIRPSKCQLGLRGGNRPLTTASATTVATPRKPSSSAARPPGLDSPGIRCRPSAWRRGRRRLAAVRPRRGSIRRGSRRRTVPRWLRRWSVSPADRVGPGLSKRAVARTGRRRGRVARRRGRRSRRWPLQNNDASVPWAVRSEAGPLRSMKRHLVAFGDRRWSQRVVHRRRGRREISLASSAAGFPDPV